MRFRHGERRRNAAASHLQRGAAGGANALTRASIARASRAIRTLVAAREQTIAAEARALGFPLAGCTALAPLPRASFVTAWLAEGRAGDMTYLPRRAGERLDPRRAFSWARALVSLAYPYRPPPPPRSDWKAELSGRIAAYALGEDYHDRITALCARLASRLAAHFPGARFMSYVDTGPIVEREWAMRAGVGWIGKNTLVLHRSAGSYFFLAELLTDLELDDAPLPVDHCGTCTRCLTACPTGALDAPYQMDPRRCLAYLTIEQRGPIPDALRPQLENWIFGCDLCQTACPWNGNEAAAGGDTWLAPHLPTLLSLDDDGFRARFGRTAVARAKRRGLLRNVAVALGNSGNPDGVPALVSALDDPEPLVRGHVAWALGQLGGRAARTALERAQRVEAEAGATAEIAAARARL
jgi:epoxyqueuosine reductase